MNLVAGAIRRPVFITSLVVVMLVMGYLSLTRLPVDQFPDVKLPFIRVIVIYPGAGPTEMEKLVAKPLEEQFRTIPGVKRVMSYNSEGVSSVWAEFPLEENIYYAEQQMRTKANLARSRMPKDIEEPLIQRYDISDLPIITARLDSPKRSPNQLFEFADRYIRPRLEQVPHVSQVDIYGGAQRELQVLLRRERLAAYELSVSQVAMALAQGGDNIPLGKERDPKQAGREWVYRSLGEYRTPENIRATIIKFWGNDVPVRLGDLGEVRDTYKDERSRAFVNGESSLLIQVHRQSGANTVEVAEHAAQRIEQLARELPADYADVKLKVIRSGARPIRANIEDVGESILLGILLCVLVVFLSLGNLRSTLITGVALPNSLLGAFVLIAAAGFSVNMLTLLGLSLVVGLLIDDAIVVRENIFRHLELGEDPKTAALEGTREVTLAVIATTLAVLSVFGPIAFVGGITGKFLREFGLTVCFVMAISLFDALTVGPMLSAYFAGRSEGHTPLGRWFHRLAAPVVKVTMGFQDWLEVKYAGWAGQIVRRPGRVLVVALLLALVCYGVFPFLPKTFMPSTDSGELLVNLEQVPGADLDATQQIALEVDRQVRSNPEVRFTSTIVGTHLGDATQAQLFVQLSPFNQRKLNTTAVKEKLRQQLKPFQAYKVTVSDYDVFFGGQRPFSLNLMANDPDELERAARAVLEVMQRSPGFVESDWSHRPGKPELQVVYDEDALKRYGVSTRIAGAELRAQMEGVTPAKFREQGEEWDIRVRLIPSERELVTAFQQIQVPNLNFRQVPLARIARLVKAEGPSVVYREAGMRKIELSADLAQGFGVGELMDTIQREVVDKKVLPPGVKMTYDSQGEQFQDMSKNMVLAASLAILFIYLVLASLYNSFLTPLALLLPLPLAVSGAFVALWVGRQSLNIYSIIATIMLLGVATKNSILLIDYTYQLVAKGKTLAEALVEAGRTRLRPILMTSMALIAGTLPVAIGLNEASRSRTSMGMVIIGGVISSTLLSLVVIPAVLALFQGKGPKPRTRTKRSA